MSDQRRSPTYLDFIFGAGVALKGCDGATEIMAMKS
jgi:hypothetical protein